MIEPEDGHTPVLLERVLESLAAGRPLAGRLIVDCTLGMGGHSAALLEQGARVLGLDRDAESLAQAGQRLAEHQAQGRLRTRHGDYRRILSVLGEEGGDLARGVDGILADLGVSSHQLGSPERGFSFTHDGPLDMRMDRSSGKPSAAELLATIEERELRRLLYDLGEEPDAPRVASAILRARAQAPILTTAALARVVEAAKPRPRPGTRQRLHPATLTFQALRIAVNEELDGLEQFVEDAVGALRRGGRLVVIAFHSLEDRRIKTRMRELEKGCVCPPRLPVCACGRKPQVRLVSRRPLVPTDAEIATNPRARSARLRTAEKITDELSPLLAGAAA